jgi:uncharacterized protein YcbK (DUF882 family)
MNKSSLAADQPVVLSKRRFIKQILYGSILAAHIPSIATVVASSRSSYHKSIALQHPQTGEYLNITYFEQGRYHKDALREIDYLLRDYHSDDIHPIDSALVDQLYDLKSLLGVRQPIQVVSGYRSPNTNAQLRHQSHRVAKHSLHMEGRAIDIRIDGVPTAALKKAAVAMQQGGVGYYPRADFVHLDTGEVRLW